MTEADVIQKARSFVANVGSVSTPPDLNLYLKAARAKVEEAELSDGESGETITGPSGKSVIFTNSLESKRRQNFTICHEIAHIVLGLPSNHKEVPGWGYVKTDPNEWMCDLFAAELLLPYAQWRKVVPDEAPSPEVVELMASIFNCSFPAAASRYATLATCPCAYITMSHGRVRFAAMSTSLRSAGAKLPTRSPIPPGSAAHRLRAAGIHDSANEVVAQDIWFQDWDKGLDMSEFSRHDPEFDSTISLVWFDDEDLPEVEVNRFGAREIDGGGLTELDGNLPWPSGKKRR